MALVCAILWIERPEATPLLLIPILIAFVGYRAYVKERQGHEKVKVLYEANRTLSESPEVAVALEGLLERALEAFHAEQAEVILFAADGGAPLRTSLGPGTAREAMAPVDAAAATALRACAAGSDAAVALTAPFPAPLDAYLHERGVRHGMLGVLRGEDRVIGTIMLANRFGLSRGFTDGDRTLFETLAANASAALQYDRLEQAVSELHELQDELQHQAHHDPLTGLANRSLFSQQVREALEPGSPGEVAVMFIDLDDFKGVNDTLGPRDRRQAAARRRLPAHALRRATRTSSRASAATSSPSSSAARPTSSAAPSSSPSARWSRSSSRSPPARSCSTSASASASPRAGTRARTPRSCCATPTWPCTRPRRAASAGYAVFTPAMRDSIVRRHDLKAELERAIEQRELVVQYQPIVDLATGQTVSVEALVRWNHPGRGRIPPLEFIPLAEETGLIVPLGRYVLEEACASVSERHPELQVQVNLSAIELEHPDLLETIAGVIKRTGIAPGRLVLEVTETLLVKDAVRGAETLQQLRDIGVQLALDDFGTGYSSLSYLRNLPLDSLKIAREFVEGPRVLRPRRGVRAPDRRPGQDRRPQGRRRGHRDARAARHAARDRLRPRPGLLLRRTDGRRRGLARPRHRPRASREHAGVTHAVSAVR